MSMSLSRMELYGQERMDRILNYALAQIGDAIAKEYISRNMETMLAGITDDVILSIVTAKIKDSIKITGDI